MTPAPKDAPVEPDFAALLEGLRVALRYIDDETCGAPPGTIRQLHALVTAAGRQAAPPKVGPDFGDAFAEAHAIATAGVQTQITIGEPIVNLARSFLALADGRRRRAAAGGRAVMRGIRAVDG